MAGASDCQCLLASGDHRHGRQIGAHGEDEWLAGETDGHDVIHRLYLVDGGVELDQALHAEGGRARVIKVVVEGDQGHATSAEGEFEYTHAGVGDDLSGHLGGRYCCLAHHLAPA